MYKMMRHRGKRKRNRKSERKNEKKRAGLAVREEMGKQRTVERASPGHHSRGHARAAEQ